MKKIIKAVLFLICLNSLVGFSQQNVGVGTLTPNANAMLEISSTDKGLLIPRLTNAQKATLGTSLTNSINDNSMLVYDVEDSLFYYWKRDKWEGLSGEWNDANKIGLANFVYAKQALNNGAADTVVITDDGKLGINTSTPAYGLEVNTTDAIGVPVGTTAQRPAPAKVGATRYNTTSGVMEVYNGTCWMNINTPPIGATYIQWSNAADPNTIYPCTVWVSTDIQNGEFIRATGGNSNVAAGGALTGTVQNFAMQDHTHASTLVVDNNAAQTTSTNGLHSHGGNTGNVSTFNSWVYIPFDDNLVDNAMGGVSGDNGTVCGNAFNGTATVGNFLGNMGSACLNHGHVINADGDHSHTLPAHNHTGTVTVNGVNTGTTDVEVRPDNVAVKFWRRTN